MANPIIKIKRGNEINLYSNQSDISGNDGDKYLEKLEDGELAYNAWNNGLYIGYGGTNYLLSVANSKNTLEPQTFYGTFSGNLTGTAAIASKLGTVNVGSSTKPIYLNKGTATVCGDSLAVSITGNAATATKWIEKINFSIASTASSTTTTAVDGSAAAVLNLPKTLSGFTKITATTFDGNLTGTAAIASKLGSVDVGSTTEPIYLSKGTPTKCGTTLAVSVTGSAAKWTNAINFSINETASTTTKTSVDGSKDVVLNLPKALGGFTSIEATTFSGKATSAGSADQAAKLTSSAGDSETPIYFSDGKPVVCGDSLTVSVTGSSSKWAKAINVSINATASDSVTTMDGSAATALNLPKTLKGFTSIEATTFSGKATSAGSADQASKLTTSAGSTTTPVYFSGGKPVALSDTIGGAAKPVYLNSGAITACSSTVGSTSVPVYMNAGTITQCTASSLFSSFTSTAGTSGETLSITIAGQTRTVTLDAASTSQGGVITTGAQTFAGTKTFYGNIIVTNSDSTSTTARSVKTTNANGTVGIYTASNRGLYDFTKDGWIIYSDITNSNAPTIPNRLYVPSITITNTDLISHITFSRGSSNYFTAPTSGYFCFAPNGIGATFDSSPFVISSNVYSPAGAQLGTLSYPFGAVISKSSIQLKQGLTKGSTPSSTYARMISFRDSSTTTEAASVRLGLVYNYINTSNLVGTALYAYQNVADATASAYLGVYYPEAGTPYVNTNASYLKAARFVTTGSSYGSSTPTAVATGQIFFKLV